MIHCMQALHGNKDVGCITDVCRLTTSHQITVIHNLCSEKEHLLKTTELDAETKWLQKTTNYWTLLRIFLRTVFSARSSSLVSGRSVGREIPSLANNDFSSADNMSCLQVPHTFHLAQTHNTSNCSSHFKTVHNKRAYDQVQMQYLIQHRTVLINSFHNLPSYPTIISSQMLSTECNWHW